MEVISAVDPSDGNTLDTYVFRFRTFEPDWVAKGGWMAGVAGPYLRGGEPATSAPGTFSSFETWDSKTADEHAGSIEDLLDRFHEYQDRNRP
ncbi:MAG: hypothetical protein GX557_15945 [Chloroflexi bacterium]|nr:hypothetical protein [Chloroflexota bacterium]